MASYQNDIRAGEAAVALAYKESQPTTTTTARATAKPGAKTSKTAANRAKKVPSKASVPATT